ncbi:alkaline phosphatase family protein [Arcanobacterium pinnipediorum]|uniref:Alkaline phosphatase family protein n=1 Tax=Arcanobacterium pinnipediorum TaxID=1503041 RepID=A0ABY5AJ45_9ACTO|nr:nucleotide pyrophosphatase/phosphodiesterase family protein [Arcanobacterium pinnipediorum]USR80122.1 alkaline phosphatase family protein [Arcanobacterium pinnipediorum]
MDYLNAATIPGQARLDHVLPAALDAVGLREDRQARDILGLPRAQRVCVVLVDGLGFYNLADRLGHAPALRAMGIGEPITSVVPSTTAAAITSFGTGLLPGMTAMTGYSLRVPHTDRSFSLIKWPDSAVDVAKWQTQPTLFSQLGDQLDLAVTIQPKKFHGSGLSYAALRGARALYGQSLEERVQLAVRALSKDARCAYLYWGEIDAAGHKHGWCSEAWIGQLEIFDAGIALLRRMLPQGTLLVITADHGMIDVDQRIDIAQIPALAQDVDVVAGEPRAVHLYTSDPQAVAQRWRDYTQDKAWVMTQSELIDSGMLGHTSHFTRQTMGDVLVFAREGYVYVDSRVQSSSAIGLIGVHGSLTEIEMSIPLIVEVI